jgi:hypothetical protein
MSGKSALASHLTSWPVRVTLSFYTALESPAPKTSVAPTKADEIGHQVLSS